MVKEDKRGAVWRGTRKAAVVHRGHGCWGGGHGAELVKPITIDTLI